jgi:hypothetical protein
MLIVSVTHIYDGYLSASTVQTTMPYLLHNYHLLLMSLKKQRYCSRQMFSQVYLSSCWWCQMPLYAPLATAVAVVVVVPLAIA